MSSHLSDLLHQFLDIYQREPDALDRALSDPAWALTDEIPILEQRRILTVADEKVQSALTAKTLLQTVGQTQRHRHIEGEIGDSRVSTSSRMSSTELSARMICAREQETAAATERGLTIDQYRLEQAQRALARQGTATEFLRFVADNIDSISRSLDELDSVADFRQIVPESLVVPFRECHVNFALGNFGSVSVLCGALLEGSLRDLLVSDGNLSQLIDQAEQESLLCDSDVRHARAVSRTRNEVVHAKKPFADITARRAAELISITRSLIQAMYRDRAN